VVAPPWGHKPPAVADPELYWLNRPPEPSERLLYWLRRYFEGSWMPNKRVRTQTGEGQAWMLGIYIWEGYNVTRPLVRRYEREVLGVT
jgi:hypothetical protein